MFDPMAQFFGMAGVGVIVAALGMFGVRMANRYVDFRLQYHETHTPSDQPIVLPIKRERPTI